MPPRLPARSDIMKCLVEAGQALHAREIATRLSVPDPAYPRLLDLLASLTLDGTLKRLPGSRFKAQAARSMEVWDGALAVNPRGFGFVTAAGHDAVYLAPDAIGGALHGDRVRVAVLARTPRGLEGRIEAILDRRSPRVAGVLRQRGKGLWLEPDDARIRGPIVIPTATAAARDGAAAVVSITRFPELSEENPEAALVAVLGAAGDPRVEVQKILVREQIDESHSELALAEARACRITPRTGRVDLRDVPLPTIDPEDARDHDDAIWAERSGQGFRVWIAIADVAELVTEGSALDREALARGCTLYLPDRAIPMLPPTLTSDVCSLLAGSDRPCLCVRAEIDATGRVKDYDVVEALMRSRAMLTYGGVARACGFTAEPPHSPEADALKVELLVIDELARKLRRARLKRGGLDLDLPEAQVLLDPASGAPTDVRRRAQDPGIKRAYQMVEELMLLANELVARFLIKRRAPAIFRVHDKPDPEKIDRFAEVAKQLGVRVDVDALATPSGAARFLASIATHPRRAVLETLLLRSMKQAVYDVANLGHFGLASSAYLHFTSPIRRYPDLLVHRAVKRLLRGDPPDLRPTAMEARSTAATTASARERATADVEREVVDLYRALLMRSRVGERFDGTVSGLGGGGLWVALDAPFVDVLVRFEALGPDHYEATEDELSVRGLRSGDTISLGDRIAVEIDDVAILRRTVYGRRVVPHDAIVRKPRRGPKPPPRGGRSYKPERGAVRRSRR